MNGLRKDADTPAPVWYDDSSSLVDSETIVQSLLTETVAQQGVHSKTDDQRCRIICAFVRLGDIPLRKRANRIAECCKWPIFYVKPDGVPGLSLQRCRDRLCPVCAGIKGRQTAARFKEGVQQMKSIRFMTLTKLSTDLTLLACLIALMDGFRELRRSDVWKRNVVGGMWAIEIKPGRKEGTWNVHLHLLVDGSYFPQDQLSDAWLKATGDSKIVDIRKVNSTAGAANYVTKYVSKPGDFNKFSDEEIIDYARSVKGRRMFGSFGNLHAQADKEPEPETVATDSGASISAHTLCKFADSGNVNAIKAVELLKRCGGYWSACVGAGWVRRDPDISVDHYKSITRYLVNVVEDLRLLEAVLPSDDCPKADPHLVYHDQLQIDDWLYDKLMC